MNKTLLVTGGTGYIGSHTCLCLLESGYSVVVLDNLSNSSLESLNRVEKICGRSLHFIKGDIRNTKILNDIFNKFDIEAVLHFAGLKSVSESIKMPLNYYENNLGGTVSLCQAMKTAGVFKLVFSSSATVYGEPSQMPISEDFPTGIPTNAYGRSKLMVEQMLHDLSASDTRWSVALLRYFNPVGAHESGLIGEDPRGIPNNLLPYISQVAVGKLKELTIFGDNYSTKDGTGIRDYIHVVDLAEGHLSALDALQSRSGVNIWNLGTGKGYSVLEIVRAFEEASGISIPYTIAPRRPGDIAECWADPTKAGKELNWHAERDLNTMMKDTWRWQIKNQDGYK
ncbi:UDP-glucose 4-epimerase GalE [Zobellella endophytica]|uniref:UDP-glucose 4-epimerase GalE n=1 Tax=Zobellella endophytica TaxID=2116700 RepID=UPI001B306EDB|nr:UDP-glucose 4-epimerase GalE [Zobellella endophytica]